MFVFVSQWLRSRRPGLAPVPPPAPQTKWMDPKGSAFGGGPGGKAPWRVSGRRPDLPLVHPIALPPATGRGVRARLSHTIFSPVGCGSLAGGGTSCLTAPAHED